MGQNNAKLVDGQLYVQAGIDPTKMYKHASAPTATNTNPLKEGLRRNFMDIDKQDAVKRFTWYNLPSGLTPELLESVLYHKGQGAFFYLKTVDKFYFLPYANAAVDGTGLDPYGRFLNITPVPLAGGTVDKDGNAKPWIPGMVFNVDYEVVLPEELTLDHLTNHAVILHDYTPGPLTQTCIPRAAKQDCIINVMADCVPLMRSALINGVGIVGVQVGSADEQHNVEIANAQFQNAAINGQKYVSVLRSLEMKEIANAAGALDTENYMRALQSLDNLRLSMYGISNGGVFQKNAHMLETEQQMSGSATELVLQDGLTLRQNFCDIVNSIWGLGIMCEINELLAGVDRNMDGELSDDQDQSGTAPGAQPDMPVETEEE